MDELFKTWWFGGVIFPLFSSIVTGIWTGLAVSRFFLFHQEIQRASERSLQLLTTFQNSIKIPKKEAFEQVFLWFFMDAATALSRQGHWKASTDLVALNNSVCTDYCVVWEAYHERVFVKRVSSLEEAVEVTDVTVTAAGEVMTRAWQSLKNYRPDVWTLIFGARLSQTIIRRGRLSKALYECVAEHAETGQPMREIWERKLMNNGK